MITLLLIIYLMIVLLMVGAILIQKSEGGGLVASNTGGLVSARGAKNFLTRFTAILATLFFVLSLVLAIMFKSDSSTSSSILDNPAVSGDVSGETTTPIAEDVDMAPKDEAPVAE